MTTKKTKTATDTKGNDLYLRVEESREGSYSGGHYFHLRARVCTQKYESPAWVPQGVEDDYSDGTLWSGLRVSCQGDERSQLRAQNLGESGPVYGFTVEYHDTYCRLDRRTCRRMAKTLDTIETKLEKLSEARGYVRSYGEYLGRVAEVLGCKGICFARDKRSQDVTGERWDWMSIGDGVNRANHRIFLWQQEAVARGQQLQGEEAAS